MGRPTASCFKIISCGTDSIQYDELQPSQNKGSNDKRRWSFRKSSSSHRLIVSETPSAKDRSPETANADLQTQSDSTIPEKASFLQLEDEKPGFSTSVDSKLSEPFTTKVNDIKADITLDEQEVLIIQTAIRTFLAQRALLKHKNVIKLQAAVRGHLVRQHAVGTLRCVQAIVRMQALVRARLVSGNLNGKENLGTKSEVRYTSISKLLGNRFAQQLRESTPRTKRINIKCDPSKSDLAWKWLERWMSVSSGHQESPQSEVPAEQQEKENIEWSRNLLERKYKSIDVGRDMEASAVPSESDENLITYGADSLDLQAHIPSPPSDSDLEQSQTQAQAHVVGETNSRDDTLDSIPTHLKDSDELQETKPTSFPGKTELQGVQNVHSEPPEPEDKRFLYGSRKASNLAFVAAQTKFKELSLAANSVKVSSLSIHEAEVESCADACSYTTDHAFGSRETAPSENSMRVQIGGSECGTELSISSTLDSPDRYEVGSHGYEQELKASENGTGEYKRSECSYIGDDSTTISRNDLSCLNAEAGREDITDDGHIEHTDFISPDLFHREQKKENNTVDALVEQADQTAGKVYKSSPEASPRSLVTVPESQGTPSSQVSVNPKKTRSEKSGSNPKRRSSSTGIRFPPKPKNDSSITSSERLTKEDRNVKQHNSFGSERNEHVEHDRRDSCSSNSLPSYMQATKSARAKAMTNSSPNSSPDVQSKEVYIKKKHSISGSAGSQGSQHIGQSLQDRKWQR